MRLLELISTPETDPAAIAAIADFADRRLGKTVVYARDTPNFIANRIGVYVMTQAIELMQEQGLTVEEVDVLTGSALGWPRTGYLPPVGHGRPRHPGPRGRELFPIPRR